MGWVAGLIGHVSVSYQCGLYAHAASFRLGPPGSLPKSELQMGGRVGTIIPSSPTDP